MAFDLEKERTIVYLGRGHTEELEHMKRRQEINALIIGCID